MPGLFITFEGPEGAGKSTQVHRLAVALEADGQRVICTREPGGTKIGERIRGLLFDSETGEIYPETEAFLHTAARAQHVQEIILPGLAAGAIVLCDRFVDSTLAYQGGGRGLPIDRLASMQYLAVSQLRPDARLLLDLPVEVGLGRRRAQTQTMNRMDNEEIAFHQRVRSAYLDLVSQCPDDWKVLDATMPVDDVAKQIRSIVLPMITNLPLGAMSTGNETPT